MGTGPVNKGKKQQQKQEKEEEDKPQFMQIRHTKKKLESDYALPIRAAAELFVVV